LFQFSRFQLAMAFLALILLRLSVGFHFFNEGITKFQTGDFTAKYFLNDAKGPLAPYFKKMLDDPEGKGKLCISESIGADGETVFAVDPEFTFLIWNDFIDQATDYYAFGSPDLQEQIADRREKLAEKIVAARADSGLAMDARELEIQRDVDEQSILAIRLQPGRVEEILTDYQVQLTDFLEGNQTEIVSHFSTADRTTGFQRDGQHRRQAALYVDSLRTQIDEIRSDRTKQLNQWTSEVVAIWDSLEAQINSLAVDAQAKRPYFEIHRPFDQETSRLKVINRVIPWFDTIVGFLLIIGLFSRLASGAAAVFLASVIATQPPFVPGTPPMYFYCIELAACLVIFATSAGRFGGLDFFLSLARSKPRNDIEE
jgi:uncharacterized membrane protein YphA (DoxX/SURF4 family)